jgi:hypothetical protein
LRRLLKTAWRRDQLRAIDVREICDHASPAAAGEPKPEGEAP